MKTCIFTLGLLLWNSIQVFATANVTFAAPASYKLKISINGKTQEATQYVRFDNMASGDYTAQITTTVNNETLSFQSTISLPDNQETSYFVFIVNKVPQLHWTNETPVPPSASTVPSQPSSYNYNGSGQRPGESRNGTSGYPQDKSYDNRSSSGTSSYGGNTHASRPNSGYYSGRPSHGHDPYYSSGRNQPQYIHPSCGKSYAVLSNQELAQLQATVRHISFDDDRLLVLQNALQYSAFMSADVRDLMKLLSFDSSRLKFAKMAFNNTYDKQNYYIVNTAFDFSSSTRDLQQYLQGRR